MSFERFAPSIFQSKPVSVPCLFRVTDPLPVLAQAGSSQRCSDSVSNVMVKQTKSGRGSNVARDPPRTWRVFNTSSFGNGRISEDLDQAKAFAHEHHVFAESSEPAEVSSMRITPILQTPVAFAFVARKGDIDLVEAPISHLGGFDHAAWFATAIEHDPALAGCRGVRLVFRAAGSGLNTHDHEGEEFIGKLGIVTESECAEVLVPLGDRHGRGVPWTFAERHFSAIDDGSVAGQVRRASPAQERTSLTALSAIGTLRPFAALRGFRLESISDMPSVGNGRRTFDPKPK